MAQIGLNYRLTVANTLRQQTRTLYEGVLGAIVKSPRPEFEIFTFANSSEIGVFYVDPGVALTPEEHLKAIWPEFEVEDEKATAAKLEALGIRRSNISTRHTSTSTHPAGKCSASPSFRLYGHRCPIFGAEKAVRF